MCSSNIVLNKLKSSMHLLRIEWRLSHESHNKTTCFFQSVQLLLLIVQSIRRKKEKNNNNVTLFRNMCQQPMHIEPVINEGWRPYFGQWAEGQEQPYETFRCVDPNMIAPAAAIHWQPAKFFRLDRSVLVLDFIIPFNGISWLITLLSAFVLWWWSDE